MNGINYDNENRLIDFEFNEISDCVTSIEKVLDEQSQKADRDIDEFFKTGDWDNAEVELSQLIGRAHQASSRFPDLFYRGLLVTIWSGFEEEMLRLAKTWQAAFASTDRSQTRKLADVKNFWERQGIQFSPAWDVLANIQEIRNLIAHQNGSLEKGDHLDEWQKDRVDQVKAFMMVRVKSGNESLTWANNSVEVTADFCRELATLCSVFLKWLIDAAKNHPASVSQHPSPT